MCVFSEDDDIGFINKYEDKLKRNVARSTESRQEKYAAQRKAIGVLKNAHRSFKNKPKIMEKIRRAVMNEVEEADNAFEKTREVVMRQRRKLRTFEKEALKKRPSLGGVEEDSDDSESEAISRYIDDEAKED